MDRIYVLQADCALSVDGWCKTHSDGQGAVYCRSLCTAEEERDERAHASL